MVVRMYWPDLFHLRLKVMFGCKRWQENNFYQRKLKTENHSFLYDIFQMSIFIIFDTEGFRKKLSCILNIFSPQMLSMQFISCKALYSYKSRLQKHLGNLKCPRIFSRCITSQPLQLQQEETQISWRANISISVPSSPRP